VVRREEKPMFKLINIKAARTERDAVEAELNAIKGELKDWTFIHGTTA